LAGARLNWISEKWPDYGFAGGGDEIRYNSNNYGDMLYFLESTLAA